MTDIILDVQNLRVQFDTIEGATQAVRGVSFHLHRGKTLAIVGESGSGKSVTSYSILRLIQSPGRITAGKILFRPKTGSEVDLANLPEKSDTLFKIRGGKIGMIFQEPMTALSPVHTIGNQIMEAVLLHRTQNKKEAFDLSVDMLTKVGITDAARRMTQYPFEFSGGMRQRVVIAMALVCKPEILIADEPTTALDVTVQAQILELIKDLKNEMGASVIFITHDLGVVAQIADDIVVMNQGLVVETGTARQIFKQPYHPYTKKLLAAVPRFDIDDAYLHNLKTSECNQIPTGYTLRPPADDYRAAEDWKLHDLPETPPRRLLLWPLLESQSV
jgi:ABC-type dipeptide/oligopeptide/nickel transport system ATPase component